MKLHPLKAERELHGWSQAKVAEAVGTNVRTVIRWEQGQTIPYPYYRERLCELFGKNARELGLLDNEENITATGQVDSEETAASPTPTDTERVWKVPPVFSPLIGRERDIDDIKTLLATPTVRLLTLLGTGGVGKTRLSIQLAHDMWPLFADGVYFVALSSASGAEQVVPLIARTLDIQDDAMPPLESVRLFLRQKRVLLILDNFEHVTQAAPVIEQLLNDCPSIKILVTSRVVLRLALEQQYRLAPLTVPDVANLPDSVTIAQYAAVELFAQRARAVLPSFQVTAMNAVALAQICARLDGLPLAIELAAARVKLLPPHLLLPRLSQSLQLLTKSMATMPERQQTLRNAIRWSYDLLTDDERRIFRPLAVFVGGCTLEVAETFFAALTTQKNDKKSSAEITAEAPLSVLDGLDSLVDKSLLQLLTPADEWEEPRMEMLETIREFGKEQLAEHGELEQVRQAHALSYLAFAEKAAGELDGRQQARWLERLERDHANLRAAMEWIVLLLSSEAPSHAQPASVNWHELALRLGNALSRFWLARGYLSEGKWFLEQALAASVGETTPLVARACSYAAQLLMNLGDLERAEQLLERAITCYNIQEDNINLAQTLRGIGWIAHQKNQVERAHKLYEQSLQLFQDREYQPGIADVQLNMAYLAQMQGDYEQARTLLEEVVARQRALQNRVGLVGALYQLAQVLFGLEEHPPVQRIHVLLNEGLQLAAEMGDRRVVASMQGLLGWVLLDQGELTEAQSLVEQCLRFYKEGGDRQITGHYLTVLGEIMTKQGNYAAAQTVFEESMDIGRNMPERTVTVASALVGMAKLALAQGNYTQAARLGGAAESWHEEIHATMMPGQRIIYERALAHARAALGEQTFVALWQEGRALTQFDTFVLR